MRKYFQLRRRWRPHKSACLVLALCSLTACGPGPGNFQTSVVPTESTTSEKTKSLVKIADATKAGGDPADASALYERVLEEHPELTKVRTSLGETKLQQNDPTLALKYFNEASKADPTDISSLIGAGQAHLVKGEPRQARKSFEEALKIDPSNIEALNGLGVCLDTIGLHGEAQKTYKKVLSIDAANSVARNNYGLSLALSKKYKEAISELTPLAADPGAIGRKARQNLSLTYAMQGDFVTAARYGKVDLKDDDIRNDLKLYGSIGH